MNRDEIETNSLDVEDGSGHKYGNTETNKVEVNEAGINESVPRRGDRSSAGMNVLSPVVPTWEA